MNTCVNLINDYSLKKKQQKKNVKSALQTVDEVIDIISKNGIPTHLYVSFKFYLLSKSRNCKVI